MTTDNRTNEMIVADVTHSNLCCNDPLCGEGQWATTSAAVVAALDAADRLVAAAGAAPQAESSPTSSYISPSLPGMIRNLWKSDPSENSVRTALKLAGDLIQELIDLRAAPVQSSSTVDEGKIANEMERHRHVMVAPGPHQCSCGFVMSENPGFSGWAMEHKLHVARAVVEAIGGESRGRSN